MESLSEISIESFIKEIQNRPAIWDTTQRIYSDRAAKKKAWEEICTLFGNDFEAKNARQKNEEVEKIQKRWKGIRDCYTRHTSKKSKGGSEATTSREYIYAPYLTFLNPLLNIRPKRKLQKESQDSGVYGSPYSESVEDDPDKLIKILATRLEDNKEKKYPDYNFFMSLLDDFSTINPDLKMDAKMEIMGVIKKYVQMSKYSGENSNYVNPSYFVELSSNSSHTIAVKTEHLDTSSPAPSHHSDSTRESIG